jgi:hypothetical protein
MRYQTALLPDDPPLEPIIALANPLWERRLAMVVGPAGFEPTT